MFTDEQLEHWFTYHPPTPEQKEKYEAIQEAYAQVQTVMRQQVLDPEDLLASTQAQYKAVSEALLGLARVINAVAPDSADKSAAIRCLRIGRMATNTMLMLGCQAVTMSQKPDLDEKEMEALLRQVEPMAAIADAEIMKAFWQANAAIACEKETP